MKNDKHCFNIESQQDKCDIIESSCHGFEAIYLKLYYCLGIWKQAASIILVLCLLVLFGSISVVASDFFCPNLQTISSRLQLSESMAGVTILAFGNGSSDLFSTFSAMDSDAGSLAIGELIGAAFFIVAVVSGCMGIIQPFQSQRVTFMRDATCLLGAVLIIVWIIYDQRIYWYHGLILIAYYISYVVAVVFDVGNGHRTNQEALIEQKSLHESCFANETTPLLHSDVVSQNKKQGTNRKPPRLSIPTCGFSIHSSDSYSQRLGHVIRPTSPGTTSPVSPMSSSRFVSSLPRTKSACSTKTYRRPNTPKVGLRPSVFGALEFQERVNNLRRAMSSTVVYNPSIRTGRQTSMLPSAWGNLQSSNYRCRPRALTTSSSAQDYFTYLSSQEQSSSAGINADTIPRPLGRQSFSGLTIPEIRLAPPSNNDVHSDHDNSSNMNTIQSSHLRQPSIDHSILTLSPLSDNESFVTAPQSCLEPCYDHCTSVCATNNHVTMCMKQDESIFESSDANERLVDALFPTLQGWHEKTTFSRISAIIAAPIILIFTLTIPVAETKEIKVDDIVVLGDESSDVYEQCHQSSILDTTHYLTVPLSASDYSITPTQPVIVTNELDTKQGWNKRILAIQSVFGTAFIFSLMAAHGMTPAYSVFLGTCVGVIVALCILKFTETDKVPRWFWMTSFVGFFVALNWIFLLANQVVTLLQVLGKIFTMSDSIMGLTVFALGNSIGDFVANTSIAKIGYPTMAISACYAGPLLNMVLGVGISSTYQVWKLGRPYELNISPSILTSTLGLIIVLLSTLIVVYTNGYRVTSQLGIWMISIYCLCILINFLLEFILL
ncbi:hypothetical protein RMCBS344292_17187 [Rhizopus microsporus]|nr:hypothetical protein RMCBS344292_17187 [Rhizopus microsporus]